MLGRPQGTHCKSGCGLTPWYLKHENYYYYLLLFNIIIIFRNKLNWTAYGPTLYKGWLRRYFVQSLEWPLIIRNYCYVLALYIDKWVPEEADLLNFVSLSSDSSDHTSAKLASVLVRYFKPTDRHYEENSGILFCCKRRQYDF